MSRDLGDLSIQDAAKLSIEEFEELLLESAFTEVFLNKVVRVYRLNTHRDALSLIWSNNLKKVINHMAKFYSEEYKKRNEASKGKAVRERRASLKEEEPNKYGKYQESTLKSAKKAYWSKQSEDKIVKNAENKLKNLDLRTIHYAKNEMGLLKKDLIKYKDKISRAMLVVEELR